MRNTRRIIAANLLPTVVLFSRPASANPLRSQCSSWFSAFNRGKAALLGLVVALTVLIGTAATGPVANAAPTAPPAPRGIHLTQAPLPKGAYTVPVRESYDQATARQAALQASGKLTQITGPNYAYCSINEWVYMYGQRTPFKHYVLQAFLHLLVDYYYHGVYCGYVYAEAQDHLLSWCWNFEGSAADVNAWFGQWGPITHCSALYYDFVGPTVQWYCWSGDHMWARNEVRESGDSVSSDYFYC